MRKMTTQLTTRTMAHLLSLLLLWGTTTHALIEEDRLQEYHARNYTWPLMTSANPHYKSKAATGHTPTLYTPDSNGWAKLMDRRFEQLDRIEDSDARYNGWISVMASALVAPTFTESGFGITKAPKFLVEELRDSLHTGLANNPRSEHNVDVIEGEGPLFIDQTWLNRIALQVLQPMHESWIGGDIPLQGAIAYGLRVYRNGSSLNMHVDKSATHVISCILHVDHDDEPDSEPWPIVIEDFQGNTNEVFLESGDMLFYESSKCLHGRPKAFKGKWYSSLFVHFYPVGWEQKKQNLEVHYAVPPVWSRSLGPKEGLERLEMVGTSMKEPDCEHKWCALKDSVKWYGPAKEGKLISTLHPDGVDFSYEPSDLEKKYFSEMGEEEEEEDDEDDDEDDEDEDDHSEL